MALTERCFVRVTALSIETGRVAWTHQQRAGMISGLVATAGGLVFGGDANRRFKAFDDRTGRVLSIHPEMKPSRGINAIFVFALPVDGEHSRLPAGGSPENTPQ